MLNVRKEEGRIYVKSEYNGTFVARVKRIGGKWNAESKEWHVSEEQEKALEKILYVVFGYEPNRALEMLRVEYNASDFLWEGDVYIHKLCMVDRASRDTHVRYHCNTIVIEGEFPARGGSARYPMAKPAEGTVLRSDIPCGVYEQLSDEEKTKITIIQEESKKALLLKEKEQLLNRIAEIEKELEAM